MADERPRESFSQSPYASRTAPDVTDTLTAVERIEALLVEAEGQRERDQARIAALERALQAIADLPDVRSDEAAGLARAALVAEVK